MPDRAYTVRELDELRHVVENKWLTGNYALPPSSWINRQIDREKWGGAVEEMVRTHMLAGHTAADLLASEADDALVGRGGGAVMERKMDGRDLIALGYKPAPWFKVALERINGLSLSGEAVREAIRDLLPPEPLGLRAELAPLRVSLTVENEEEQTNLDAVRASMDLLLLTPTVVAGSIMPDACPAGSPGKIPVGGVVGARDAIHPGMHSADICCSVMATVVPGVEPAALLDAIHGVTHFGGGGRPDVWDELPADLHERMEANSFLRAPDLLRMARTHLRTQGDGNHFAFVGRLESTGETTLVTHHGSRGVGALLYKAGMAAAERIRRELSPETLPVNAWLPASSDEGRSYWEALQLVREWTKLNHTLLHDKAMEAARGEPNRRLWNEHNFVFRDGDVFWHGKGATPIHDAFLPDTGGTQIVPLNMAEPVLLIQGERTDANLGFAPHGAGRNMSRTAHMRRQAARHGDSRGLSPQSTAAILARETAGLDVRFFSGRPDLSELPSAYKSAKRVQEDMERFDLARVVDRVLPYGCIMAGDWEADAPWRKKRQALSPDEESV